MDIIEILKNQLYSLSLYARQIAGTVVLLLIVRFLSVYEYGLFSSYKAIASFCLLFANLGYNEYILVSSKKNVRDVQLKIGFFIINALFVLSLIMFFSWFSVLESHFIFVLVLVRTFFDNIFFLIMLPYFQASGKFDLISYVNIIYSVATILIALISYFFNFSLITFLILSICLGFVNFIQVSYFAKINYLMIFINIKRIFKKLDKTIFSYMGVLLCSYLYMQIPALFVATFVEKEQAALYFSAMTIATIISLLITAQVQKIVPEMINVSVEKVKQVLKCNLKFIMSLNLLLIAFFAISGKFLLLFLYGKEYYANAYLILLVLAVSNISIALAAMYGAYITASGNQKIKIKMQIEAIIISLFVLLLFCKYGVYAAVLAYFLSATHICIRYTLKTKKLLKKSQLAEL